MSPFSSAAHGLMIEQNFLPTNLPTEIQRKDSHKAPSLVVVVLLGSSDATSSAIPMKREFDNDFSSSFSSDTPPLFPDAQKWESADHSKEEREEGTWEIIVTASWTGNFTDPALLLKHASLQADWSFLSSAFNYLFACLQKSIFCPYETTSCGVLYLNHQISIRLAISTDMFIGWSQIRLKK